MMIYADFHNRDDDGYVRLNTMGTIRDLGANSIVLKDGQRFTVSDYDLEADIIVRPPGSEGVWRAEIIGEIREKGDGEARESASGAVDPN